MAAEGEAFSPKQAQESTDFVAVKHEISAPFSADFIPLSLECKKEGGESGPELVTYDTSDEDDVIVEPSGSDAQNLEQQELASFPIKAEAEAPLRDDVDVTESRDQGASVVDKVSDPTTQTSGGDNNNMTASLAVTVVPSVLTICFEGGSKVYTAGTAGLSMPQEHGDGSMTTSESSTEAAKDIAAATSSATSQGGGIIPVGGAGPSTKVEQGDASPSKGIDKPTAGDSYLDAKEYAYTKRDEFTSEIFKIEIGNIPKNCAFKQFKKFVEKKLKTFKPVKIKIMPKPFNHAYATFRNEEERKNAIRILAGQHFKGRKIQTKFAKALPDPVALQRAGVERKRMIEEAAEHNPDAKRAKGEIQDETVDLTARLNDSVSPFWKMPYSEQLAMKNKLSLDFMKKLTSQLRNMMELKGSWVDQASEVHNGLCAELRPCIPSPVVDGYRNKCEFTIAEGPDGEKTVGFRVGSYKDGYSGVVEPSQCIHISDITKKVAATFQKYIRRSSLPVYDLCFHTGYWQTLTVKSTTLGESMAIIQFSPQSMTKSDISIENENIKRFFEEGEGKDCNLTALYSQPNNTRSVGGHSTAPLVHLLGEKVIHDTICDVKFRISPNAFFQVNTKAAEKMIEVMRTWLGNTENSYLLDICCGTGSLGLCLAKYVSKVIGVEVIKEAIEDAEENARMNGITNTEFVCGKAEEVFAYKSMKRMRRFTECVGILDPPRAGVHKTVIDAIRKYERMDKLIYVSCAPEMAIPNLLDLCRPTSKRVKSVPFRLVTAIPIDLFPHTKGREVLMLFERDMQSFDAVKFYKFFY